MANLWNIAANASIQNTDVAWLWTASTKDFWTWANQLVELDWNWKLPAVDGSNITWVSSWWDTFISSVTSSTTWTWAISVPSWTNKVIINVWIKSDSNSWAWDIWQVILYTVWVRSAKFWVVWYNSVETYATFTLSSDNTAIDITSHGGYYWLYMTSPTFYFYT